MTSVPGDQLLTQLMAQADGCVVDMVTLPLGLF